MDNRFITGIPVFFACLFTCSVAWAHDHAQGYVLKAEDGEKAAGAIIKASPKSGTQGGVAILHPMPAGFSTGLHFHLKGDEFFYVISGSGTATIGDNDHKVSAGDFIFVPAGQDHEMTVGDKPMEILEFMDKPGLAEEFRIWHREFGESTEGLTVEAVNAFARKHGTIYKTID